MRLHLCFAREASRAVILRQGPSRQFRMILWHTDTDTFQDGQWIKRQVIPGSCQISPDAQHFMYFLYDGRMHSDASDSYMVLSRPPYFTALALFPDGGMYGTGGSFIDDHHYWVAGGPERADIIGSDDGLERLYRTQASEDNQTGLADIRGRRASLPPNIRERWLEGDSWQPPLDRYDTMGGCLYRRRGLELELIRDFTEMTFEEVVAPYDTHTEPESAAKLPWHPLDRDGA